MRNKNDFLKLVLAMFLGICLSGCGDLLDLDFQSGDGTEKFPNVLEVDIWSRGEINKKDSGGTGEQWFKFVATASTQRIYIKYGSTNRFNGYLYDSNYDMIGREQSFGYYETSAVKSTSWSVNPGKTYYFKVTCTNYPGTYKIGFSNLPAEPETVITDLDKNTWLKGAVMNHSSGGTGDQWFKFTPDSSTNYVFIKYGTTNHFYGTVYDSNYDMVGSELNFGYYNTSAVRSKSWTLNSGKTYYIQITCSNYPGSFWISYNSTGIEP